MNDDIYQPLREIINNSELLEEASKVKYLSLLDDLKQGKVGDFEAFEELNEFLDKEYERLENAAIAAGDTELINLLTEFRNNRLEYQKEFLGIS